MSSAESNAAIEGTVAGAKRQLILVAGMHRSGTSAVTRVLSLLGLGLPTRLARSGPDNPKGYWEPASIVDIHDEILSLNGLAWDDPRPIPESWFGSEAATSYVSRIADELVTEYAGGEPQIVVKDPRLCKVLPLWFEVCKRLEWQPLFVVPLRNPLEVAHSLQRRNGFNLGRAALLWLRTVLDVELASRRHPRTFIFLDELLADWQSTLEQVNRDLGTHWEASSPESSAEISSFLCPDERHEQASLEELGSHPGLSRWVVETYRAFFDFRDSPGDLARICDRVRNQLNQAQPLFLETLDDLKRETTEARSKAAEAKALAERLKVQEREVIRLREQTAWLEKQRSKQSANQRDGLSKGSKGIHLSDKITEGMCLYVLDSRAADVQRWSDAFHGPITYKTPTDKQDHNTGYRRYLWEALLEGVGSTYQIIIPSWVYVPRYFDRLVSQAIERANRDYPNWAVIGNDALELDGQTRLSFRYSDHAPAQKSLYTRPVLAVSPYCLIINHKKLAKSGISLSDLPGPEHCELAMTNRAYRAGLLTLSDPALFTVTPNGLPPRIVQPSDTGRFEAWMIKNFSGDYYYTLEGRKRITQADVAHEALPYRVMRESDLDYHINIAIAQQPQQRSITIAIRTQLDRPATLRRLLASICVASQSRRNIKVEVALVSSAPKADLDRALTHWRQVFADLELTAFHTDAAENRPSRAANCLTAFKESVSDYVWFVDDDDFLEPEALYWLQRCMPNAYLPLVIFDSNIYQERWTDMRHAQGTKLSGILKDRYYSSRWWNLYSFANPLPICSILFPRRLCLEQLGQALFCGDLSEDYALLFIALTHPEADVAVIQKALCGISVRHEQSDSVMTLKDRSAWYQGYADFFAEQFATSQFGSPLFWELGSRIVEFERRLALHGDINKFTVLNQEVGALRDSLRTLINADQEAASRAARAEAALTHERALHNELRGKLERLPLYRLGHGLYRAARRITRIFKEQAK